LSDLQKLITDVLQGDSSCNVQQKASTCYQLGCEHPKPSN